MDKVLEKAKELKEEINQIPEVKEYLRLKKLYEESSEIKSLEIQLKYLPQGSEDYHKVKEQYNNYPLVINLNNAKEEMLKVLRTLKDILEI